MRSRRSAGAATKTWLRFKPKRAPPATAPQAESSNVECLLLRCFPAGRAGAQALKATAPSLLPASHGVPAHGFCLLPQRLVDLEARQFVALPAHIRARAVTDVAAVATLVAALVAASAALGATVAALVAASAVIVIAALAIRIPAHCL